MEHRSQAGSICAMRFESSSLIFLPQDRVASLGIPRFTQSRYKTALNVAQIRPQMLPSTP